LSRFSWSKPFSDAADQQINDHTEREIDESPEVDLKPVVPEVGWEGRQQSEVHQVAQDDRQQGLKEVEVGQH
jgi:hypothetical protein